MDGVFITGLKRRKQGSNTTQLVNKMGERVLITGGAGFIGSHLAEALVKTGYQITILDDFSSGKIDNLRLFLDDVSIIKGNVLDDDILNRAANGCRYILHLAAITSVPISLSKPLLAHEVNLTGTLKVCEAAVRENARMIFSSSAAVYGDRSESGTRALSPYGVQKFASENYIKSYCQFRSLDAVILRYFNVFGPRQDPLSPYAGVITKFIAQSQRNEQLEIFGDGEQTRDFIFVEDVVSANQLAMSIDGEKCSCMDICTGQATSLNTLAETVIDLCDSTSPIVYSTERPGDIKHSVGDPNLARKVLAFDAQYDLKRGLQETLPVRASRS